MNRNLYLLLLVLFLSFSASVFPQQTSGSMVDEPNPLRPMNPSAISDQTSNGLSVIVADNIIRFTIADQAQNVKAILVNMQGQSTVLVDKNFGTGEQQIDINQGRTYASGVYVLSLVTQTEKITLKLVNAGGNFLSATSTKKDIPFEFSSKDRAVASSKPSRVTSTARTSSQANKVGMAARTSPTFVVSLDGTSTRSVFFQGNNTSLFLWKFNTDPQDLKLGMMPGTSPAAVVSGRGIDVFFQANTGNLWRWNSKTDAQDFGLGMMKGTNPAALAKPNGEIEVFYQANTGALWRWNSITGAQNFGYGMMKDTSPAFVINPNGETEVFFQANTGNLWRWNSRLGGQDFGFGMMKNTSPAVAINLNGETEVFFQANTGNLWRWNSRLGGQDFGYGMMKDTSPAVAVTNKSTDVFYNSNTGSLSRWNSITGGQDLKQGMAVGTNPAVLATSFGINVFFQGNNTSLWRWNPNAGGADALSDMDEAPSPVVKSPAANNGAFYPLYPSPYDAVQAAVGEVWYKSIDEGQEYGGVIYKIKGKAYYGLVTIRGQNQEINPASYYPANSDIVAYWHTHPNNESRTASSADIRSLESNPANKGIGIYTVVYRKGESRETPRITSFRVESQQYMESKPATPDAYAATATAKVTLIFQDPRDNKSYRCATSLKDQKRPSDSRGANYPLLFSTPGRDGNVYSGNVLPIGVSSDGTLNISGFPIAGLRLSGEIINIPPLLTGRWKEFFSSDNVSSFAFNLEGIGFGSPFTGGTGFNFKKETPENNWGEK